MENQTTSSKKGNSQLLYIGIALLVVIGGFLFYSNQNKTVAPTTDDSKMVADNEKNESVEENKMEEKDEEDDSNEDSTEARVINVKGSPFKFEPSEIKVKKGEKVKIVFMNEKGMHDWVNDEFDAKTKQIKDGQTDSVEFTADKTGTFEYYCSVGNHRQMGMVGNLIVE